VSTPGEGIAKPVAEVAGAGAPAAQPALVTYTHWMYALHALSAAIGVLGSAFVVTQFLLGIPSIVAVIMNYVKRDEVRGTWLESHFNWQLRTFWFALLWVVLITLFSLPLMLLLIGFGTYVLGMIVVGLWVLYRVARGWLKLKDGLPVRTI
jgi:uncharacterized membrane protein